MYDDFSLYIYSTIVIFITVIIAVKLSLNGKLSELLFQVRFMQKRLESATEEINKLREKLSEQLNQSADITAENKQQERKDSAEKPVTTTNETLTDNQTIKHAGDVTQPDATPTTETEVKTVGEQQRIVSPIATIEVPVVPVGEQTNGSEPSPSLTEDEVDKHETATNNKENEAKNELTAAEYAENETENEACEVANEAEAQDNATDIPTQNEPQPAEKQPEPAIAFVQVESEETGNKTQQPTNSAQEQKVEHEPQHAMTGKEYLESLRKEAKNKGYNEAIDDDSAVFSLSEGFNFEKFIGENLLGKIGILALVLGISFFVKYAIDQNWIGHTARTALGYIAGTLLMGIAWQLSKRYRPFSSLLAGGGCAVYYLTTAIAFHYYQIFTQPVAFGIMVCVTLFMAWTASHYGRRELAVTALVGGFLAPFLTATGTVNLLFLYVYMAILNLGCLYLAIRKRWNELPLISIFATYVVLLMSVDVSNTQPYAINALFYALFWLIFAISSITLLRRKMSPLFTGFHLGGAIFSSILTLLLVGWLNQYGSNDNALAALVIGIFYLGTHQWMRQTEQCEGVAQSVFLSLGLAFATMSLPMFFSGSTLTICFSAEMVLLLWLYCTVKLKPYGIAATLSLVITAVCLFLNIGFTIPEGAVVTSKPHIAVFNSFFISDFFRALCLFAFAAVMDYHKEHLQGVYKPWNNIVYGLGVMALYLCISSELLFFTNENIYVSSITVLRLAIILGVAVGFLRRYPASKCAWLYTIYLSLATFFIVTDVYYYEYSTGALLAIGLQWLGFVFAVALFVVSGRNYYKHCEAPSSKFTVFFNIAATLLWISIVRTLLMQTNIQQYSAGLSLSLAAVGALQMLLGMRLPNKTMRLLSIGTFGVIIVKLALYDVWLMPAVGRIVVFIILGALLLVVSFMYQKLKDTLNLSGDDQSSKPLESEQEPTNSKQKESSE